MRHVFCQFYLRTIVLGFALLLILVIEVPTFVAQPPAPTKPVVKSTPQADGNPTINRWKNLLDSLSQEARTVFPEERRPYAMVDVANAYWVVDREAARSVYLSALDAAILLNKQDKKYRDLVIYVLSAATRRDATLAKELSKRLLNDNLTDRDNISSKAALDLLEQDPTAAEQLAEAFAPNGLNDGSAAFLIFSLAKKDITLSDRLFSIYLGKVIQNENFTIDQILRLAGYSFGYAEYYGVDRRGQLSGASFLPLPNLTSKPALVSSFLDLAYRRLSKAIEQRDNAVDTDTSGLNIAILFASEYLVPEVAKFSPDTLSAWQQLQQRGIVGTTLQQTQQANSYIQQIYQSRVRTREFNDPLQTPEQKAEATLENVEKLVGTCQRDVVYSRAALTLSSRKNPKRALDIAGKIEDLKQSESVKEVIAINLAEAAIEASDFEEAEKKIGTVRSPEHKTALFLRLAQELIKNSEYQQSDRTLSEGIKIIEKLTNPKDRASLYFSLSSTLLKTDPAEAQKIFGNAIKALNKLEPEDKMEFSIPIKVRVSCAGEQESWYGGSKTLPDSTVFEALKAFAKQNPDQASGLAEEIGDKITKIRSLATIVGIALTNLQKRSNTKGK